MPCPQARAVTQVLAQEGIFPWELPRKAAAGCCKPCAAGGARGSAGGSPQPRVAAVGRPRAEAPKLLAGRAPPSQASARGTGDLLVMPIFSLCDMLRKLYSGAS